MEELTRLRGIIEAQHQVIEAQNERIRQQEARLQQQDKTIAGLREENALLRQKVDLLVKRVFGAKSEKLDANQLALMLGEEPPADDDQEEDSVASIIDIAEHLPRAPRPERRPRLPEHLEVIEEEIIPEEVQANPGAWRCIGREVSEQLDYIRARFVNRRQVRLKYVHRAERARPPIIAPLPPRLADRSLPAPGLLAHVVISKYADALPLYRQEQIYKQRHGVEISRQTMVRWVERAAYALQPVYKQMRADMLAGGHLQVDETPIRYLRPGAGKAPQGYFWTYTAPGGDVIFDWHASRATACLDAFLGPAWRGTLQSDGYQAYAAYARANPQVTLAGCWAHARRGLFEARDQAPVVTGWLLRQIAHLYLVERRLRTARAGPAKREALRCAQSIPIMRRIRRALVGVRPRYLPASALGRAITYLLNQWPTLGIYIEHGHVEIDNNNAENAIRPVAVGRKNFLFIGAEDAGWRSAVLYSVIASCRRRGIEPMTYLTDVLARLPLATNHTVHALTPANWAKEHRHPLQRAA